MPGKINPLLQGVIRTKLLGEVKRELEAVPA